MRWREATEKLLGSSGPQVKTFVVIGRTQLPFTSEEATVLLRWIGEGGHFVLIDRDPEANLIPRSGNWMIASHQLDFPQLPQRQRPEAND